MKRHYFLGLGANLGAKEIWRHTFAVGREKDREELRAYLEKKYGGEAILTKNGRTGLAIALKRLLRPGDEVLVNGFTCYAVYEALEASGVKPIWADISPRDLNFTVETLKAALKRGSRVRAIIVQNSLGNPVEMDRIEKLAKRKGLLIIEDLAHSTGVHYPDGREVGKVGIATVLSFGKDKAVDATSGGAVVLREGWREARAEAKKKDQKLSAEETEVIESITEKIKDATGATKKIIKGVENDTEVAEGSTEVKNPYLKPRPSDVLRARFYPLLGAITRGLSYVHLSGPFMRLMLRIHWVERSADNHLDFRVKIAKFEAKIALERLKKLPRRTRQPLRSFYLVRDRETALKELQGRGYYFSNFWYERPVAPERYYDAVGFPEEDCPVATEVAQEIVNFPNYYNARELLPARKIIETYEVHIRMTNRGVFEQVKEVALKEALTGGRKLLGRLADKITEVALGTADEEEARRKRTDREAERKEDRDEIEGIRESDGVGEVENRGEVEEVGDRGEVGEIEDREEIEEKVEEEK